jgi:hypothetical protein
MRLPDGHEAVLTITACLNPDCKRYELIVNEYEWRPGPEPHIEQRDRLLARWSLIPEGRARSWPDFVPAAIRADYLEACRTESPSPRASAALARRCLRNILHDFYQIAGPNLIDEIDALRDNVEQPVSEALNALRSIENISAPTERDPRVIVDVAPGEASAMIDLLELLIMETYVAHARRAATRARVEAISATYPGTKSSQR